MDRHVGIVLVSHSRELAEGLRDLAEQMGSPSVPVIAAGGIDDGGLGTSYELVLAAVEKADTGAGVAVLPDLGSSVLTARAVLAARPALHAVLVDAPFVEGTVAATVTAASGASLAEVVTAAEEARDVRKF